MKRLNLCFSVSLALLCSSCVKFKTETTVSYNKTEVTESSTADGKTRRTVHTSGFSGSNPKEVMESITDVYVKEELDQVDDQQALGRIAQLDPDPEMRISAINKLTFQPTLGAIAQSDTDLEVRKAAINQLTFQPTLGSIAQKDDDPELRKLAISRLTFQPTLGAIAQEDKDPEVRKAAIRKLTFTPTLNAIVAHEQDPEVRQVAQEVSEGLD